MRKGVYACGPVAMLLVALVVSGSANAEAAGTLKRIPHGVTQRLTTTVAVESQVLKLLNVDRARYGIRPLRINRMLTQIARAHSSDMDRRRYFAHITPDGIDPFHRMSDAGVHYRVASENVGLIRGFAPTQAARVLDAQMMSEPPNRVNHRAVILNGALRQVGIGVQITKSGQIYVTEDFTN